jgi:hypothetical protein
MLKASRVLVLLFGFVTAPAFAQAPAVQELPVDVTAAELVKRVRAAVGDEAAWEAIAARKSVGSVEIGDQSLALEVIEARGDRALITMKQGDALISATGCDGKTSWEQDEEGVRAHTGAELTEGLDDCAFLNDVDLASYKEIKVAGKARQGERIFYLVDAYTARGLHDVLTIDASTYLPYAAISQRRDDGKLVTVAMVFSDYRRVSGLMMPHLMNGKFGGAKFTMTLTSIVVNPPIDGRIFALPTKPL